MSIATKAKYQDAINMIEMQMRTPKSDNALNKKSEVKTLIISILLVVENYTSDNNGIVAASLEHVKLFVRRKPS